jgi:coiled-coil domain-containing protein 39
LQLDIQSTRQQELLYNAEFQIQQMERKVARGLGERSDEEKKVLTDQIAKLEKEEEEVRRRHESACSRGLSSVAERVGR